MRLTLVIPSLQRGGAERVMSLLAGLWAEAGHRVTLVTLNREGPPAYFLHPSVRLRNLGLPPEPAGNFIQAGFRQLTRIRVLRMAIRESKPDVVLSFLERTNVLTLIATRAMHIPVVVSERADPSLHDIGRLWRFLRWATYPMATRLVCQTISTLA
ncbi:MAG TPA: glycosyltransferase, partial [Candidatus Sulfotelmatobacter sp.]|nr:glycosyltransferase [Candidatus Sulfotelmatobacter sp.]